MNADIDFCLKHLDKAKDFITHNGRPFLRGQLKAILLAAKEDGHTTVNEIPDTLVERVLAGLKQQT